MTKRFLAPCAAAIASLCSTGADAIDFKDYLIMNVCRTSSGAIDKNKIPGRDACTSQSNLSTTERPHYHLRDFGAANSGNCRERRSGREITNMATSYNGKIRALSYVDYGADAAEIPGCPVTAEDPQFRNRARGATEDRASVRWVETREGGIGFLMASGGGPIELSYYETPICETFPNDSRRFYDGWPLASVALPTQYNVFQWRFQESFLFAGSETPPDSRIGASCPGDYHSGYTMWAKASYKYMSGITLPTIVTYHYSNQQSQVANPGLSKAQERAYFTDEWGFSRYELWRREDYYGTTDADRQRVRDQAASMYSSGRCTAPYDTPPSPTPVMRTGTMTKTGTYSEKVVNGTGTVGEIWYMVNCKDYTKLVRDTTEFRPSLEDLPDHFKAFWR